MSAPLFLDAVMYYSRAESEIRNRTFSCGRTTRKSLQHKAILSVMRPSLIPRALLRVDLQVIDGSLSDLMNTDIIQVDSGKKKWRLLTDLCSVKEGFCFSGSLYESSSSTQDRLDEEFCRIVLQRVR